MHQWLDDLRLILNYSAFFFIKNKIFSFKSFHEITSCFWKNSDSKLWFTQTLYPFLDFATWKTQTLKQSSLSFSSAKTSNYCKGCHPKKTYFHHIVEQEGYSLMFKMDFCSFVNIVRPLNFRSLAQSWTLMASYTHSSCY